MKTNRQRLTEAVDAGLRLGGGAVAIESLSGIQDSTKVESPKSSETKPGTVIPYSEEFACPTHGAFLPEMSPRIFSFNNPLGACPGCQGLGVQRSFSEELIIDSQLSVEDGCVTPFRLSMHSN